MGTGFEPMNMVRVRVRDHMGMGTGPTCQQVMGMGTGTGSRPWVRVRVYEYAISHPRTGRPTGMSTGTDITSLISECLPPPASEVLDTCLRDRAQTLRRGCDAKRGEMGHSR